jgi:arabidopsis histidine kinase 2/3/4 (cytokinin receptor)
MAITTSIGTLVIALLIGYIIYATAKRIARVEDDFQEMSVLKKRAEDADIAKSQVNSFAANNSYACLFDCFS